MQYVGSKFKMLKTLIPTLCQKGGADRPFVDLFCGSCSVVANMPNKVRYANDLDSNMIALYKDLLKGVRFPNYISRETYDRVREHPENYDPSFVAFVGYACGFGGKFFGGYARCERNVSYAQNGSNTLEKIKPLLKSVRFTSKDYSKVTLPKKSLLYMDPPYADKNTGYRLVNFDVERFWKFASSIKGHLLFVSQYSAPAEFIEIHRELRQTVHNNKLAGSFAIEKIFVNEETYHTITK